MTPQQAHRMSIVYLMLTCKSDVGDKIFGDPPNPPVPGANTNLDVIKSKVADVPGSADVIDDWLDGDDDTANDDRDAGPQMFTDFLSTNGQGWGGPNGCPHDLATMMGWLDQA